MQHSSIFFIRSIALRTVKKSNPSRFHDRIFLLSGGCPPYLIIFSVPKSNDEPTLITSSFPPENVGAVLYCRGFTSYIWCWLLSVAVVVEYSVLILLLTGLKTFDLHYHLFLLLPTRLCVLNNFHSSERTSKNPQKYVFTGHPGHRSFCCCYHITPQCSPRPHDRLQ